MLTPWEKGRKGMEQVPCLREAHCPGYQIRATERLAVTWNSCPQLLQRNMLNVNFSSGRKPKHGGEEVKKGKRESRGL